MSFATYEMRIAIMSPWVDALLDQLTGLVARGTGISKGYLRVCADSKDILFAGDAIAVAPELCAAWPDFKV